MNVQREGLNIQVREMLEKNRLGPPLRDREVQGRTAQNTYTHLPLHFKMQNKQAKLSLDARHEIEISLFYIKIL